MKKPPQPPLQDKQDREIESNDFIEAMTAWDGSEWTKKGLKQAQNGMRKIISKAIQIAVEEERERILHIIEQRRFARDPIDEILRALSDIGGGKI